MKVVCFALWCFLCAQNLFVKKIVQLEIIFTASFTILLSQKLTIFAGFEHVKNSFRRNSVTGAMLRSLCFLVSPCYSNNIYFAQKESIKMKIFETFECSGQILSNCICQFWNDESIPLQILYPSLVSWKVTPLDFFSSNNVYFAHKEPIKVKIFQVFERSGQNLSNSLCQFLNKSRFLSKFCIPLQFNER